jgi:NAD(P)H-flavin reductase
MEAPGVSTLVVEAVDGPLPAPVAGQFHMVWAFGVGEAPISVSRIGARGHEHTVGAVGAVSSALASTTVGDVVGLRGPFGTGWDVDPADDRDLLVVAGGLGQAPVRPVVDTAAVGARRTTLVLGARDPDGLFFDDDRRRWADAGVEVHATVDLPAAGWHGEVGLVTAPLPRALADPAATTAVVCGPEVMIRVTAERLVSLGVPPEAIAVSLERNMHCGLGQCGRCQLGPVLLCRDGAVLPWPAAAPLLGVRGW